MTGEVSPQAVSIDNFLIPAQFAAKILVLLLQLPGTKIATDGLILGDFCFGSSKLCFQVNNGVFKIGNGFLCFLQQLFQLAFLFFLYHILFCCRSELFIIFSFNRNFGRKRQRLCFNLLHGFYINLLLLNTLNGLLQFCKFLCTLLPLIFQDTQVFPVFALLLPFDTMRLLRKPMPSCQGCGMLPYP